jgi:hypothetical protein
MNEQHRNAISRNYRRFSSVQKCDEIRRVRGCTRGSYPLGSARE